MNQVCIFDYSMSGVFIYDLPQSRMSVEEITHFIESLGFRLIDISWMSADQNIEIYDERN